MRHAVREEYFAVVAVHADIQKIDLVPELRRQRAVQPVIDFEQFGIPQADQRAFLAVFQTLEPGGVLFPCRGMLKPRENPDADSGLLDFIDPFPNRGEIQHAFLFFDFRPYGARFDDVNVIFLHFGNHRLIQGVAKAVVFDRFSPWIVQPQMFTRYVARVVVAFHRALPSFIRYS